MMIILFATTAVLGFLLLLGVMIIASLAERQEIAKGKASELMIPLDFRVLEKAISEGLPVWFKYTDRHSVFAQRRVVYPRNFWETPPTPSWVGKVWLWSSHLLHGKREQYDVSRIIDVRIFPTLLEAVLDPSLNNMFWDGSGISLNTTVIR